MSVSRRTFLRTSTTAALFAGLSLSPFKSVFGQQGAGSARAPFQTPEEAKRDRVFHFTRGAFEPHLNTDFVVRAGVIVTTLRLIEIEKCGSSAAESNAPGKCFSLTFRADRPLSDLRTIHVFEHAALGEFNMFVAPTKKFSDPEGLYYVAVINHQTGADAQ